MARRNHERLEAEYHEENVLKTYKLIIAALVCALVIPLAFALQVLLAR